MSRSIVHNPPIVVQAGTVKILYFSSGSTPPASKAGIGESDDRVEGG